MAKKRGHNEGSIRKRPDGTWESRYTIGIDANGKQIQRSVYANTRTEVATKLTLALEKLATGKYIDPSHMLLFSFLDQWLNSKKNKIKPSTYDSYEQNIEVHIKPSLGKIKLKNLKSKQIQDFYDQKFERGRFDNKGGLSGASIIKIHNILHGALENALNNRIIPINPTKDIEIPRGPEKERRVLTLEEQKAFISALDGDRLKIAFLLEISTGMRLSEILCLKWSDINLDERYLVVRETLSRIKNRNPLKTLNYLLVAQEPKTEKSKRLIPIPESIIPLIEGHKKKQEQEKEKESEVYQNNNLVFCTQLGTYIQPRNFMRSFYRIIAKAEIPKANVHSLRHTFATRMLEMGESAKVVQEILGHKNITTTLNTYTHVLEDTKKKAMTKMNNLIFEINT